MGWQNSSHYRCRALQHCLCAWSPLKPPRPPDGFYMNGVTAPCPPHLEVLTSVFPMMTT